MCVPYLTAAAGLILLGTVFYSLVEGWHPLDAAYFCAITLATVGYGDLVPVTRLGRLLTMVYIIIGLGLLGAFIATVTSVSMNETKQRRLPHVTGNRGHRLGIRIGPWHGDLGETASDAVAVSEPPMASSPQGSGSVKEPDPGLNVPA